MLFSLFRASCYGWTSSYSRTRDFAEVVAFFDLEIDTGAELLCNAFDGNEWLFVASWSGVPPFDWMGNPIPTRDGALTYDPSNEYAVRLSRELDVPTDALP